MPIEYELPWDGVPFRGASFLSFDCETAVHDSTGREYDLDREIPPLVLATASDGVRNVVLSPEQLLSFFSMHRDCLIIGHNIAFDFWVTMKAAHKESNGFYHLWMGMAEQNLLDDSMYTDFLVRLADPCDQTHDGMRNLGQLARMVGLEADKDSPYRMRFEELIGQDWSKADPGFFEYACADTYVTWHVYKHLLEKAATFAHRFDVPADQWRRHGPLTSRLQTRASIVLAQIGRNGVCIDQSKVDAIKTRLRGEIDGLVDVLAEYNPPLFRYYKKNPRTGERKVNKRTLVPNLDFTSLRVHLEKAADEEGYEGDLPRTPKGEVATRLDDWRRIAPDAPIVKTWSQMADTAKVLQFVAQVDGQGAVHSGYRTLVRTGRTSCTQPNIQQMPKERWFRELFVPREGRKFAIIDYSAIELRTLAAVLLKMFGRSRLADVLRAGTCPHTFTASMVTGTDYEAMMAGVKAEKKLADPGPCTKARQAAKAINFGVPGGLGAKRLCAYARTNYGVEMSEEEAKELKDRLITKVYPELSDYLAYDIYKVLGQNMGADSEEIREELDNASISSWYVERVLRRDAKTGRGTRLPEDIRASVWDVLERHNQNPRLRYAIENWESDTRGLCGETAITLTGRIRAGLDYGEARNTRFQGLAADGAKIALWNLLVSGYKIVAFIHDEIVCEVPAERAEEALADISRIMKEAMASVLLCDIPVEVEGVVADAWVK